MISEQQFDSGTVVLNYAVEPSGGQPLTLLHGLSYRWQSWLPIMPALAPRWHLFAPDLRGFGRSDRIPGAYQISDYTSDIVAFLRGGVDGDTVLVGHSLGAVVAVAVAAEVPDLVRALILEEPPISIFHDQPARESRAYESYRRMRDISLDGPSLEEAMEALTPLMPSIDAVELRSRAMALVQRDPEVLTFVLEDRAKEGLSLDQSLSAITCPVLLLQGNAALGSALDDQRAAWMISLLEDCTHVAIPDAGHFIHQTLPVDFSRLVLDFLETV
jgi:pimeloyl-ACP methyl ester carboxylesterase